MTDTHIMQISEKDIHVWFIQSEEICNVKLLSQCYFLLNDEERLQHSQFHFEKDQHQYLLTRSVVRSVLSKYTNNILPRQWCFKKNPYGKPSIGNTRPTSPLSFNISHTKQLIVMAVTLNQEIGIDVEYLPKLEKKLHIAQHLFSALEIKQLLELPIAKQNKRFADLWTLKEAYIKACGKGLFIPLDQFSFCFSQTGKVSISFTTEIREHTQLCQFWQIHPNTSYKVSLALKGKKVNTVHPITMYKYNPLTKTKAVNYPLRKL